MGLLRWAAGYYQQPPGEVYAAALPRLLRSGRQPVGNTNNLVDHGGRPRNRYRKTAVVVHRGSRPR